MRKHLRCQRVTSRAFGNTGFFQEVSKTEALGIPVALPLERMRGMARMSASPNGCTEALMLANGFPVEMLVELIRTGLAFAQAERMMAGGKQIEVARVRITEAGRRVLGGIAGGRLIPGGREST
jgi:hypothetical protein